MQRNIPLAERPATLIVFRVKQGIIAALFALLCLCPPAWGGTGNLEKQLNSDYVDKTLTLRHFYQGDHLRFHSDGTLAGEASVGPWTIDGQIAVEKVHLNGQVLEFQGRRINVVFDSKNNPIDQLTTLNPLSGKERKEIEKTLRARQVRIEIELPSANVSQDEIALPIHAVFLMLGESMIEVTPPFWRSYFAKLEGRPASMPPAATPVYTVTSPGAKKGGVSAPHAVNAPDPEYSDEARKAKYQGVLVLWLVVDSSGKTKDIQVVRPVGVGLDEKALAAVSTWTFEPARKDGQPVAVMVNVEVSFRLY